MLKEIENCQVGRKCGNRMIQLVPFNLQSADKQTMNHNYREAEIKNDPLSGVMSKHRRLMQQRVLQPQGILAQAELSQRKCLYLADILEKGNEKWTIEFSYFLGICCITAYTANFQSHSVLEGSTLSFTVLTIINTNI